MNGDILEHLARCSSLRLFLIAVVSRLSIIAWMWFAKEVIGGGESYDSCESFYPSSIHSIAFLYHWDNVHFRHIATEGYSHEHVHAFFPGVPALMYALDRVGMHPVLLCVFAVVCYSVAMLALRALTIRIHYFDTKKASSASLTSSIQQHPSIVRFVGATVFLFLLSPTNVFTVVGYTESFFACFAFVGLYCDARDKKHRMPSWWFSGMMISLLCASVFRSNGFILGFVVMVPSVVSFVRQPLEYLLHQRKWLFFTILRGLLVCLLVLPYVYANYDGWKEYCVLGGGDNTNTQGEEEALLAEGCSPMITSFYPMIQLKYWNVGWFRQWTLVNAPNFLIAGPPLAFGIRSLFRHFSVRGEILVSIHMWHLVFLWYLAITTIHVQVVNRLVFACPALYWIGARQLVEEPNSKWTRFQVFYCIACSLIGPMMFANHMNWT